jgi:activator of 2-hydroxyglutaryl-CoA dehydratase
MECRLGLLYMKEPLKSKVVHSIVNNLAKREKDIREVALKSNPTARFSISRVSLEAQLKVNETLVLMPFYGVAVGTGHSVVSTRFAYLNLT